MTHPAQDALRTKHGSETITTTVRVPEPGTTGDADYADVEFHSGNQLVSLTRLVLLAEPIGKGKRTNVFDR